MLGAPVGSSSSPRPANVEDELHPRPVVDELHPHASLHTDADDRRHREELAADTRDGVRLQASMMPQGLFNPDATDPIGVVPNVLVGSDDAAVHTSPEEAAKQEKVAQIAAAEEAATAAPPPGTVDPEKAALSKSSPDQSLPVPVNKEKRPVASSADSSDESSIGKQKAKKKRGLFGRKSKDAVVDPKDKKDDLPQVGLFQLFRFSTRFEVFLMIIGLVLAVAAGATQPLMTLIFSRFTNDFTEFAVIEARIVAEGSTPALQALLAASKATLRKQSGDNALYLMAIGLGMAAATYSYMLIWNYTGEMNAKRVRENYLRAVLRQEVILPTLSWT